MLKRILKSQSGFSIVEGLIATGLVAMSILAVGYMVNQTTKVSDKARVKQEVPGAISDTLNRARMMLLNTMDVTSGLRSRGICTMLEPQRIAAGIVPVDLVLNRATLPGNTLYDQTSWVQSYSPDWILTNYKINSSGGISFDLQPTPDNPYIPTTGVDLKSVKSKISISVRSIDPAGTSQIFGPISTSITRIDAKKAAYQIASETTYNTFDSTGKSFANSESGMDLVSVIDVGSCDVKNTAGNLFTLSPAGTGIGDPSGRSIYNNTEFKAPGQKPMEIYLLNREVTQGKFIDNRLSADRSHDKTVACTESVFRCPKASGSRQFRSFLNVTADVNYFVQNMYGYQERMQVIPSLTLFNKVTGTNVIKGSGAVVEYTNQVRMSPTQDSVNYKQAVDGLYYPVDTSGNLIMTSPMSFTGGINRMLATVSNVQNMCSSICQPDYKNDIYARLSLATPNFKLVSGDVHEQDAVSSQPLHCTMCWMKGCTRSGLKTFGSVNSMPAEPLDAQIPECAAAESSEVSKHNPYKSYAIGAGTGSCLSGKIVAGKLELTARSCTDSLPVLCFAFGQYTFGRDLADKSIINSTFGNAPEVCRNLGRESILPADLHASFTSMGVPIASLSAIPQVSGRYQFLNLSKVGTFTAPQGNEEIGRAIQTIKDTYSAADAEKEFWVALRQDVTGVMADIPQAKTSNSPAEQHMIFFSAGGVLIHDTVTETPYSYVKAPGSGPKAYVLFNHPKFRGTVVTTREQDSILRFLCMKKSDRTYFVSAAASQNFELGGEVCHNEDGLFIAPHTPRSWLQALMAASPHGAYLPFTETYKANSPVWIAYENNLAPAYQKEFGDILVNKTGDPVLDYAVNRDGAYVLNQSLLHEVKYETEVTKIETDKDGKKVEVKETVVEYKWEPDPSVKFSIACFDADALKVVLRSEVSGCLGSEERVLDSNIKKRNIALAWVLSKDKFDLDKKEFIRIK